MLLAYDQDRCERVFVAQIINRGDIAKLLHELKADIAEGDPVMIEIWKLAPDEIVRERVAKRRLDFFNS